MKQQPSDSNLRPTKLCQVLLCALVVKIGILGYFSYDSFMSGSLGEKSGIAYAADAPGAPSAVSIQAPLPDVGIDTLTPGTPLNPSIPGAIPGKTTPITAGVNGTEPVKQRTLPSLGSRAGIGTSSPQNSTSQQDEVLRQNLLRQQDELTRKEESLKLMEKDLSTKLQEMQALENRLKIMMKDADKVQDDKIRHLIDMLSNMKPAQAAQVLESLDPRITVKILAGMKGRKAGEVLSFVNPKKAANFAESLSRMQLPAQ